MSEFNLTEYSKGSGCGCKIAPDVLEKILNNTKSNFIDKNLLVGNSLKDDAAVYDLGNGQALVSTVDFFMPIVNDAFTFGKIAAANAISDVYAMGGKPILANAILGWPIDKLPAELAQQVILGAQEICTEVNISLAGGHSIDSQEPIFGLAVNGLLAINHLKRNSGAGTGNFIYLTKPLGSGVLAAALKRNKLKEEHKNAFIKNLYKVNSIGQTLGSLPYVTALTDVTGFGLLGHLIEMLDAANLSAELNYTNCALLEGVTDYTSQMIVPDNLYRNWNSYKNKVSNIGTESFFTLNDPQTNGGLLVAVEAEHQQEFELLLHENNLASFAKPIAKTLARTEFAVIIK